MKTKEYVPANRGNRETVVSKKLVVAVVVCLVVIGLGVAGYRWFGGTHGKSAADFNTLNAVWAVQGPFKDGTESAQAMRYASKAVGGPDAFYDAIDRHPAAYDAHPDRWEGIRKSYLQFASGPAFEAGLEKAKELGAVVDPRQATSPGH